MDRKKLILDLDNTLISSEPLDSFDIKKHKKKAAKFNFHDMDDYYVVFERPGLQEFLDYVFENFDVSVWTAASKEYGAFIIENIILKNKERKLELYLFSYHCDWSEKENRGHKGLSLLWENLSQFTPENTVIIDDLAEVSENSNGINIKPFNFTDKSSHKDKELEKTRRKLEEFLEK